MAQAGVSRAEVGFADSWGPAPGGLDHWGDATGWDAYAAALGYRVDATAAVGAIAQWHGGERGGGLVASAEGHVAYVAGVAPDGSATIEDYNGAGGAGAYGTLSGVRAPRYLHVADAVTTLDTQAGGSPPGGSAASHAATVGSGSTGGASASVTSAGRTGAGPASPRPGRRLSFAAARALRPALVRLPVMLDQLRALDAAAHPGG